MTIRAYDEAWLTSAAMPDVSQTLSPRRARGSTPPMTHQLGLKSWATGALVLAAMAGCTDDGGKSADPPPATSSSATSSGAASASPTSASGIAVADATSKLTEYFATVDALGQDPTAALDPLESVAISTQLSAERRLLESQHRRGERQVGETAVAELMVQSVNLDNSDPAAGRVPTVVIDACWDVSDVDVLDKDGASIVLPDRPDTGWTRYTIANYGFDSDSTGGWRVASGQDLERAPCDAS